MKVPSRCFGTKPARVQPSPTNLRQQRQKATSVFCYETGLASVAVSDAFKAMAVWFSPVSCRHARSHSSAVGRRADGTRSGSVGGGGGGGGDVRCVRNAVPWLVSRDSRRQSDSTKALY